MSSPPISPDGAYWWDGQTWRPIEPPVPPASPAPVTAAEAARPSWLPEGTTVPSQYPAAATPQPPIEQAVSAYEPAPAPAWSSQPPAGGVNRSVVMVAAVGVAAVLLVCGGLAWALVQSANQATPSGATTASLNSPSPAAAASPSPAVAAPLTADLSGEFCPVRHVGDSACWKGTFVNTGPGIAKLAMIFIVGGPYSDWFTHHGNAALSGFYTTPGCDIDAAHSEIVCGAVPPGSEVDVYLGGDVTVKGGFNYAVKFADISSGSPVYVDQHPDGTHDIVSWTEVIS